MTFLRGDLEAKPKPLQHFVHRHYLRAWASSPQAEFIWAGDQRAFQAGLDSIGAENDLYQLKSLSPKQVTFLLREAARHPIPGMEYITTAIVVAALLSNADMPSELIPLVKTFQTNVIDDIYTKLEDDVQYALGHLREGRETEVSREDCVAISNFVCFQLSRTPASRRKIFDIYASEADAKELATEDFVTVLNAILAGEVAESFKRQKSQVVLLKNNSGKRLITSDMPTVNLRPVTDPRARIYWPISPERGVILAVPKIQSDELRELSLCPEDSYLNGSLVTATFDSLTTATFLNEKIRENKLRHVYAREAVDVTGLLEASKEDAPLQKVT